jgi:hypothetical protein
LGREQEERENPKPPCSEKLSGGFFVTDHTGHSPSTSDSSVSHPVSPSCHHHTSGLVLNFIPENYRKLPLIPLHNQSSIAPQMRRDRGLVDFTNIQCFAADGVGQQLNKVELI